MSYDVKVSTGDVAAKAASIQREAEDLEARLGALTSAMSDLAGSWSGAASTAFQELFSSWKSTATQAQAALSEIGVSLNNAGQRYDENEASITAGFNH